MIQSIYWTYSWSCKQLKKIWSVIRAQFKLLYHIPRDIVFLRCQDFERWGEEGVRKNYIQEKKRKKKTCMLLQLWIEKLSTLGKQGNDFRPKHSVYILNRNRISSSQYSVCLLSSTSQGNVGNTYYVKVLLSKLCCLFFYPHKMKKIYKIYIKFIHWHVFWINIIHFVCCEIVCNIKLNYLKK